MKDTDPEPLVTIIIPARNEACFIDRCLLSVFSADPVPGGMEVLVVDGMSTDGTREIIADWCRKQPSLRLLNNPRGIVPAAMNIGIRAARGEWIMRLDAHSEYPANYFTLCVETSRKTKADNVGGDFVTLSQHDGFQGDLVRMLTTHRFGVGNAGFRVGAPEGPADTVVYGCFKSSVFEHIGLYNERLVRNQDYELNRRLLKAGGSIWRNPAIRVRYYNQGSLKGLLRQAFVTGQWNPWMWYVAPYSFAWRHAIPLGFVTALVASLVLAIITPTLGGIALKLVLVPYLLLSFVASSQQCIRYRTWMLPILPVAFFAYHLAYGLGGLRGILLLALRRAPV